MSKALLPAIIKLFPNLSILHEGSMLYHDLVEQGNVTCVLQSMRIRSESLLQIRLTLGLFLSFILILTEIQNPKSLHLILL